MSRSSQQAARIVQELIRLGQSGKLSMRWIVGLLVLVAAYLLLQPVLERSLGFDLPGLDDLASETTSSEAKPDPPRRTTANSPAPDELLAILQSDSHQVYQSPAGLRYTRGSQQGHRLKHVMTHARDDPNRTGQHGVFDSNDPVEIVALIDEAYLKAQAGRDTRVQREEERTVYDVNLRRRVGYIGGTSGHRKRRPTAQHLRLVVEGDRLITAFPVLP